MHLHSLIAQWTDPKRPASPEFLNLASRDSEGLGSRTSDVEANFHSIRNSGAWHFGWEFAICLSARTSKVIVSPRAPAGRVIRPERHSKSLQRRTKNFARP
jgi:hypothetical protein